MGSGTLPEITAIHTGNRSIKHFHAEKKSYMNTIHKIPSYHLGRKFKGNLKWTESKCKSAWWSDIHVKEIMYVAVHWT